MPVLYLITCAAPPAAELPGALAALAADGWNVCVVATPAALDFVDVAALEAASKNPVRSTSRKPGQDDPFPAADAVLLAPCTFNTLNKWAAGNSDTLALGILNELLGSDVPIVAAVWAKAQLRRHPAFGRSLEVLRGAGVEIPVVGSGPDPFPWEQLRARLTDQVRR